LILGPVKAFLMMGRMTAGNPAAPTIASTRPSLNRDREREKREKRKKKEERDEREREI
jgi:hypothetical protein